MPFGSRRPLVREITSRDLERLTRCADNTNAVAGDRKRNVPPSGVGDAHVPKEFSPADFRLETTTVWSFPRRGAWATHRGDYRGNWPPQVPRNLILRYTAPGDVVLDPMCGSGTTLIETKLLGRRGIGIDIDPDAILLTRDRLSFRQPFDPAFPEQDQRTYIGDARDLRRIEPATVDLVTAHPPYHDIIAYSSPGAPRDLSHLPDTATFVSEMGRVARECHRVLKPGKIAAILVGDLRRKGVYVPLAFQILAAFLTEGFILKDDIIKLQWNCRGTARWQHRPPSHFHLIMHEHLFILQKADAWRTKT